MDGFLLSSKIHTMKELAELAAIAVGMLSLLLLITIGPPPAK